MRANVRYWCKIFLYSGFLGEHFIRLSGLRMTLHGRSIIWPLVAGGILCLATSAVSGEEWPIVFTDISMTPSAYKGVDRQAPPNDCQPKYFDPKKTQYRRSTSSDGYELSGKDEDESVSMQIDGWGKQGDARTVLPEPFSLTKYTFACASESSQVFELKKNGERYGLYTHISAARFSPDLRKLVLFNYLQTSQRAWQELRRIIEIETKQYSSLPVIKETTFLADVTNDSVVTYGMPVSLPSGKASRRRIVGIWGHNGKLIRALSAPIQDTFANAESSDDGIGMLPNEPTTFYHLTRTGENICTLRLQDIQRPDGRRSIQLAVPGLASDPAAVGMHIQIDLDGLRLKGGAMKYRVSASGRGDVLRDWGPWRVGKD